VNGTLKAAKRVRYYWVNQRKLVVCTTQRAASASMAESLAPAYMRSEVIRKNRVIQLKRKGAKVLLWIRDPLDRIACAYPIFGKNTLSTAVISPNEYAEKILAAGNVHWSPQTYIHRVVGHGFLPTHVYPFESLAESWPMELGYRHPLQHVGAQPGRLTWTELADGMSASLILKIIEHWRADITMHAIALGSWESRRQPEKITTVQRGGEKDAA
jgi:hypothetical protein